MGPLTVRAPPGQRLMLLNVQRRFAEVYLLHYTRRGGGLVQPMAAVGADLQAVMNCGHGQLLGRQQGTFVLGVAELPPRWTGGLVQRGWRCGGLDDVRGRWFGGSRGVLPCRGQLLLQFADGLLHLLQLLLQAAAPSTVLVGFASAHEEKRYERGLKVASPLRGIGGTRAADPNFTCPRSRLPCGSLVFGVVFGNRPCA